MIRPASGFERLLLEISTGLISLPVDRIDREIGWAQQRICEFLGLDVSGLWQWSANAPSEYWASHFYQRTNDPPLPERMEARDYFPWSQKQVLAGKIVVAPDVERLPEEAAIDKEWARRFGIASTVTVPLSMGATGPIGALSFNTSSALDAWSEEIVERAQLVAQVFAAALARKRLEQSLQASEARLDLAAAAAGMGFWSLNTVDAALWTTPRTRDLLDLPPTGNLTFDRFLEGVHDDDREKIRQVIDRMLRTGEEGQAEYRVVRRDGTVRWMCSRGRRQPGVQGGPDELMGTTWEITDRKRTEDALSASEALSRTTFEEAALGIAHVGPDGRWLRVNDTLCRIIGRTREQLVSRDVTEFGHPDDARAETLLVQRALAGEISRYTIDKRFARADGDTIWVELTASVVRDGKRGVFFVWVVSDITKRTVAEEELRRMRIVSWHADRMAQAGTITASIAHELNQPLAAILSNAQAGLNFLADGVPDLAELREILTDIVRDDKRAASVINGLRSMLRRSEPRRERFDLAELIRSVLDMLHAELITRHVKHDTSLEPDCRVSADRAQIGQVLLNLMMNAVEAMQTAAVDHPRIEIELIRERAGRALVSVRDSGPGIASKHLGKVFESFWTTKPQGMGIGLSICRTIIETHGGSLDCRSEEGRGATFQFSLPLEAD